MKKVRAAVLAIVLAAVPSIGATADGPFSAFDGAAGRPFSKALDLASLGPAGAASLMPASFALVCDEGRAFPAALAYAEAFAVTYGAKELLKETTPKARPYAYVAGALEGELLEEANESFPSGHTALAFCAATCLATMLIELEPDEAATPWLVAAGYAFATATGVLRVYSGCHFISDVVGGAVLGSGIGWLVPWLNIRFGPLGEARDLEGSAARARLVATPSALIFRLSY
ncbi:MAG: phosphatase PAP2 family protein [Spirochaetaceae bacterium]|nr:phosphatase PAP2 family protein [Spirochaetaceae bacterium]